MVIKMNNDWEEEGVGRGGTEKEEMKCYQEIGKKERDNAKKRDKKKQGKMSKDRKTENGKCKKRKKCCIDKPKEDIKYWRERTRKK